MKQFFVFALSFFWSISAHAQEITISGQVTDNNNEPLIGASVVEVGTNNGVTTDFDGNFSISVGGEDSKLSITYLGFLGRTVTVGTQRNFSVSLSEDAASLEEVIVIGYGTQRKKEITGAVSVVSSETIEDLKPTRIEQALQGQVAGVQITPGSISGCPSDMFFISSSIIS